jgi:hypothetical protein
VAFFLLFQLQLQLQFNIVLSSMFLKNKTLCKLHLLQWQNKLNLSDYTVSSVQLLIHQTLYMSKYVPQEISYV